MNNQNPEIDRLAERIAKDPKSKLFVSLAEEHKKAGNLETAISVLLEGLQYNPGYSAARSLLGKLLLAKGDLSGAQKEFEEVIMAMPDNHMARKSLGDILILQNKPQDALAHYKVALSLNPRDEEQASLVADIEAGRDVKSRIKSAGTRSTAEPAVTEEPWAWPDAAQPPVAGVPPSGPDLLMTETEEPEEVLIVEPLESEAFQDRTGPGGGVPEEQERETSVASKEYSSFDFSMQSQDEDGSVPTEDTQIALDAEGEDSPPSMFEEAVGEQFFGARAGEEDTEQASGTPFADVSETDDFTTDTLAELYIAQGFHEKAIEIYERMLSDKPNSRGLQDKLAAVRASASHISAPVGDATKATEYSAVPEPGEYIPDAASGFDSEEPSVFNEPSEYRPRQDSPPGSFTTDDLPEAREYVPPETGEEITIDAEVIPDTNEYASGEPSTEDVFPEFGAFTRPTEPEEQLPVGGEAGFDALVNFPVQESSGTGQKDADFEPREYLPPKAVEEPLKREAAQVKTARPVTPAGRKETIARLETWLSNIKKEK